VVRSKSGTLSTDFLFTGEQFDAEARPAGDLYYLRARYYDPASGRFLTRDRFTGFATMPQSQNRYSYARNNPTLLVDPYGNFGWGDVVHKAKDVGRNVVDVVTNPENIVSGVQMVSGVVMVASYSGGAVPVCVVSAVVYTGASTTKLLMADNVPEKIVVAGTSILGYCGVPAGRVTGVVIAGLSDLAEALVTKPRTAYALGYPSGGSCPAPTIRGEK
jgi:RHS repeat-associated protein